MLKLFLIFFSAINLTSGEIKPGSVPNSIVYQGRVEKDNAPLNGLMHIKFRIYKYESGGSSIWESDEYLVEARAGIFSVTISSIPVSLFSQGSSLYLEVEIEGEKLSPREKLSSVIYAMVAKKLEDGAWVHFSSITVGTNPNAVGPNYEKAVIMGGVYTDRICFLTNKCMVDAGIATAVGDLTSPVTSYIKADTLESGSGDIIFQTSSTYKAIITNSGNFGIGTMTPSEKLVVNGNAIINNNLRVDGNFNTNGILNSGILRGANNEQISMGVNNDRIDFIINNSTVAVINGNNLGIGTTNPSEKLEVSGNIKASDVYANNFITTTEIKSNSGNLIIQNSNFSNVGIGTDTPKEKLHVGGSIRADMGIIASTATFSSDVIINGDLNANNFGKRINLSSTTVYGTLDVKGQFTLNQQQIAGLASTQTFTAQNTFLNEVRVSSNLITDGIVSIGAQKFNYPGQTYLQIGDSNITYSTPTLYLSAGLTGDGIIGFYKGANKIATLGTSANNFNIKYGNSDTQKIYIDQTYFKVYNSTLIISPTSNDSSPAIYVDGNSNVSIGTTTTTGGKLSVNGNIKILGSGNGIVFNDGSILTSSSSISVGSLSNIGDAVILADSDNNGYGSIVMRVGNNNAITVDNTSKVGIGTVSPSDKLNVIGGDVVVGNIFNPYSIDGVEDLIVAGKLVVGDRIEQRSSNPVNFTSLYVSQNVYLSTSTGYGVSIGKDTIANAKLDVNGNAIFIQGITASSGTFTNTGDWSIITSSGVRLNAGTIQIGGLSANSLVATDGSKNLVNTITAANLRNSVNGTSGTGNIVFNDNPSFTTGINVTGYGVFTGVTATSGTFTNTGDYSIKTSSGILVQAGIINLNNAVIIKNSLDPIDNQDLATKYYVDQIGGGSDTGAWLKTGNNIGIFNNLGSTNDKDVDFIRNNSVQFSMLSSGVNFNVAILSNNSIKASTLTLTGNAFSVGTSTFVVTSGKVAIGKTNPVASLDVNGNAIFSQGITATSGTFTNTGDWSIITSSGIKLNAGRIETPAFTMTTGASDGYFLVSDSNGNAIWKDASSAGLGDKVIGNEVLDADDNTLTRTGFGTSVDPYKLKLNLNNINTWQAHQIFSSALTASTATITGNAFSVGTSTFVVSSGKVAIDKTNPNASLDVNGNAIFTQGITASSGTFTNTADWSILTSSGIKLNAGTIQIGGLSANSLVATDGSKNLVNTITAGNLQSSVSGTTGSGNLVFSNSPQLSNITVTGWGNFSNSITASTLTLTGNSFSVGTSTFVVIAGNVGIGKINPTAVLDVSGNATFTQGITASSGTFKNTGDWSILTSSGIKLNAGTIKINSFTTAGVVKNDANGNLSGGNTITTSEITGTLSVNNGGTGNSSFSNSQPIVYNGSSLASFSGFNGSFTVAKSTDSAQGCVQLNFQYGILSSTASVSCP